MGVRRQTLPFLVGAVGISTFGDMLAYVPIALHIQERLGSGLAYDLPAPAQFEAA